MQHWNLGWDQQNLEANVLVHGLVHAFPAPLPPAELGALKQKGDGPFCFWGPRTLEFRAPSVYFRLSVLFIGWIKKLRHWKQASKKQLCENSLHKSVVFQVLQCLCGLSSFFPEESWVSADRRGEPWKMLGSSQSNSIRGRNDLLKHQEGKSFAAYQQLGPNDITRQNQRKWANQICIKALFVCLLRKLQFAFKLEVKKKISLKNFWPWNFASLNCFQLLEQTWK